MEQNSSHFATISALQGQQFLMNCDTSGSFNNNYNSNQEVGLRVLHWRSKVVPGLSRTLIGCDCGCGLTFDEFGNTSTALQGPKFDVNLIFTCPNGCCDTSKWNCGTKLNQESEANNMQPIESTEFAVTKAECHGGQAYNNQMCEKGEYELPADHLQYAEKIQQVIMDIDCENCKQAELSRRATRFQAFLRQVNLGAFNISPGETYTELGAQLGDMFEYSERVNKFYQKMSCEKCRNRNIS